MKRKRSQESVSFTYHLLYDAFHICFSCNVSHLIFNQTASHASDSFSIKPSAISIPVFRSIDFHDKSLKKTDNFQRQCHFNKSSNIWRDFKSRINANNLINNCHFRLSLREYLSLKITGSTQSFCTKTLQANLERQFVMSSLNSFLTFDCCVQSESRKETRLIIDLPELNRQLQKNYLKI